MSINAFHTAFLAIPELNTPITGEFIHTLSEYCAMFETKNEHSLALNSHLLAVHPIYFTTIESDLFFSMLGVARETIDGVILEHPLIDPSWKIVSDPYNHMVLYTAHRILISSLSATEKDTGLFVLFKMLQYKFFTSLVKHYYEFGANRAVMDATIKELSARYDIVKYGTWKEVIEARSKDIYVDSSIHYKPLLTYNDDKAIIYVLTDIQSRIRQKVKLVTREYYKNVEQHNEIRSYGLVDDIDGEKIITTTSNVLDNMIASMIQQVQTPSRFIDDELISVLADKFKATNEDMFRRVLYMFAEQAQIQGNSGDSKKTITVKLEDGSDAPVMIGYESLITELIQKTYRFCIMNKTNMKSKGAILNKTMNLYSSSRVSDDDILTIKRSITYFVSHAGESVRVATVASMSIAFIVYVIIKSMAYL